VGDFDAVVDGAVVEGAGEVRGEDVSDAARVAVDVVAAQEELEAWARGGVGGARGVVAEHVRAAADAGGGVGDAGRRFFEQGAYGVRV
jgi:hypothetical protein